ncbi:SPOR domain-containing protein [uncultured Planktosalinus sp.]|uniref:HU domain-containing protein n=1 Tax=uncultured Planktosalinus sp. TaxID=1810935 RepID=UPI0030DA9614
MELSSYISDLLYRYECVILPGLGAFLTQSKSAKIDFETNTFYPPGKSLSFNSHLQTNDGLLANHIARVENSSYEEALSKIRAEIKILKKSLELGKTVSFKNIGELKTDINHYVVFHQDANSNFLIESFGLTSFASSKVFRESKVINTEKAESLFNREKRAIPLLKYAAIGLLAIGLTGMSGLFVYNNAVEEHNLVEKQKANSLVENQIQQATFVVNSPLPSLNVTIKKPLGKYHIVAGAFRVEENAMAKVEELKEKGFPSRFIGINNYGLHQVVYNSFTTKEEALSTLRSVKQTENIDAWLLVQELN